jgi:hypothetical protein
MLRPVDWLVFRNDLLDVGTNEKGYRSFLALGEGSSRQSG